MGAELLPAAATTGLSMAAISVVLVTTALPASAAAALARVTRSSIFAASAAITRAISASATGAVEIVVAVAVTAVIATTIVTTAFVVLFITVAVVEVRAGTTSEELSALATVDHTSIARHVGIGVGTPGHRGLPLGRNPIDPDATQPVWSSGTLDPFAGIP
ncbi:MAG: hypothetical protein ACR2MQ_10405 [Gemmatimonadaceae bacterium]